MRHLAWIVSLVALSSSSVALAEGPQQPPPQQQPIMQPVGGQQQYQQQPAYQQQPVEEEPQERGGRGIEYGAHLVVPIFLVNSEVLDLTPGIGVQGRVGWEFAALTTELNIGIMWNGSNTDALLDIGGVTVAAGEYSLFNIWIGGGVRYAFFNPSAFVPFVGAGIQLNIWNNAVTYDDGFGTTTEGESTSTITFGFNGTVGFAYEISRWAAVEAGAQINYSLPPDAADVPAEPQLYISPFVGGTLYY